MTSRPTVTRWERLELDDRVHEAYGQLCQFLPALLSPLLGSATEVMSDAVEALGETALKLRATASSITATDARSAGNLKAAGSPSIDLPL